MARVRDRETFTARATSPEYREISADRLAATDTNTVALVLPGVT